LVRGDRPLAAQYLAYWERLSKDPVGNELRVQNHQATPLPEALQPGATLAVFSPRPAGALQNYTALFARARNSLCFTAAFGINQELTDVLCGEDSTVLRCHSSDAVTFTHSSRYVCLEKRGKGHSAVERRPFNRVAVGAVLAEPPAGSEGGGMWLPERVSGLNEHVEYIHTKVSLSRRVISLTLPLQILMLDPFSMVAVSPYADSDRLNRILS
jgi:hypothetical protein